MFTLKPIHRIILFVLFILAGGAYIAADTAYAKKDTALKPLDKAPDALIEPGPGKDLRLLVVDKDTQRLYLYEFNKGRYYLLKKYECTTGENIGDKQREGDKKTPEGVYIFNKKSLEHELAPIYGVLAYPMDYPNFWDRYQGKNGSGIWLHGTNRKRVPRDTNGCIALENIDLIDLEPYLGLYDTPIVVYDKIRYKSVNDLNKEAAEIKAFIESWRSAWEKKDMQAYKSAYSKDFVNNDGRSYDAWMNHKSKLNTIYRNIKVDLKNLRIFRHQDVFLASFEQYYKGDAAFTSNGVKRLFIKEVEGKFKIVGEEWHAFPAIPKQRFLAEDVKQRVLAEVKEGKSEFQVASVNVNPPENRAVQVEVDESVQEAADVKAEIGAPDVNVPKQTEEPVTVAEKVAEEVKPSQPEKVADVGSGILDKSEEEGIRRDVDEWLDAWRRMNAESYIAYYHPDFKYKDMNRSDYKDYKIRLAQKYSKIDIKVDKVDVKIEGDNAKVTFIQDYTSDKYHDYGLKTLVLVKYDNKWRIREEIWQDISAGAKP